MSKIVKVTTVLQLSKQADSIYIIYYINILKMCLVKYFKLYKIIIKIIIINKQISLKNLTLKQ